MATSNPFLRSGSKPLSFSELVNNTKEQGGGQEERNVFKKVEPVRNEDSENNKGKANVQQNFKSPPNQAAPFSILFQPKSQPLSAVVLESTKQNIQLEIRIDGYQCPIAKQPLKTISNLLDTTVNNMRFQLPLPIVQSMNDQMKANRGSLKYFSKLYDIIKRQNSSLFYQLQKTYLRNKNFMRYLHFSRQQIARFKQGLFFYYQIDRSSDDYLRKALKDNIFYQLCEHISGYFHIDILRAYYLVKNIHEELSIIRRGSTSFNVDKREKITVIENGRAVELIQRFMNEDKMSLLNCYVLFLQVERPPYLTKKEEIDILWGNIAKFDKQITAVQMKIVNVFELYWNQASDRERQERSQLFLIKECMKKANLTNQIRNRLMTMGMCSILNKQSNQMSESDFQGNYRPLYRLFIRQNEENFDFRQEGKMLGQIQLTKEWVRHVQNYLQNTRFNGSIDQIIDKCTYLTAVLLKLREKKHIVSEKYLSLFINEIFKNSLIIIGIILLYKFKYIDKCEQYLPFLIKTSQEDLNRKYSMLSHSRKAFTSLLGTFNTFVIFYLDLFKMILAKKIEVDDIITLQQIISKGRIYSHNFEDDDCNKFVFFTVYCQCLQKFPSFAVNTQRNIEQLILMLAMKKIKIDGCLQVYHKKIMVEGKEFKHYQGYLKFILTKFMQKDITTSFVCDIIQKMNEFPNISIEDNIEIANLIGESIIFQQNTSTIPLSSIYKQFVLKLIDNILQTRCKSTSNELYSRFLYLVCQIIYWSKLIELDFSGLQQKLMVLKDEVELNGTQIKSNFVREETIAAEIQLFNLIWQRKDERDNLGLQKKIFEVITKQNKITEKNLLEILTFISQHIPNYLILLFMKQFDKWQLILREKSQLSVIQIDRMITFSIMILKNENHTAVPRLKNMYSVLVNKVSQSIRERGISIVLLNKFIPILASAMNRLDYASHVQALRRCMKGKTVEKLSNSLLITHQLVEYLNYLICLFQVQCNRNAYTNLPEQITQNIQLFQIFAYLLLAYSSSHSTFFQQSSHYLHRYFSILTLHLKNSVFSQVILSKISSFQKKCLNSHRGSATMQSLIEKIQSLLHRQNKKNDDEDDQQLGEGRIKKQFNDDIFLQLVNSYLRQKDKSQKEKGLQKLNDFLLDCEKYKVNLQYNSKIQCLFSNGLSARLANQLLRQLKKQKSREVIVRIFQNYVEELNICTLVISQQSRLKELTAAVSIINQLVGSCLLSPLLLAKNKRLKSSIEAIIQQCRRGIKFWNYQPIYQPAKTLDSISLINLMQEDYVFQLMDFCRIDYFSVWSFAMLGVKLDLIQEIIILHRQLNGLFTAQLKPVFAELLQTTELFAEIAIRCSQIQNHHKIQTAKNFIEKQAEILKVNSEKYNFVLDLKKMKEQTREIAEKISILDLQLKQKLQTLMQKFKE